MPTRNIFAILVARVKSLEGPLGRPVEVEAGEEGLPPDLVASLTREEQDELGALLFEAMGRAEYDHRLQKLNEAILYRLAIEAVNGTEGHGSATGADE